MITTANRKKLVKEGCANYQNGMCLIRDIKCPLVIAFEYRGKEFKCEEVECSYFNTYVLGFKEEEKRKSNILPLLSSIQYSHKPCKRCGTVFKPTSRGNRYCSDACKESARKLSYRLANAKR